MPTNPNEDTKSAPVESFFVKHDRVRHPEFGRGYVAEIKGDSCLVFFLEDGQRRLLKQVKLELCS
jgi:hypothetical protein